MNGLMKVRGITDAQKVRLGEIARARFGTPNVSRLIRELVDEAVKVDLLAEEKPPTKTGSYRAAKAPIFSYEKNRVSRTGRIELRLQFGERMAINELAEAAKSSPQHYLVNLIRNHLTGQPSLLGVELEELRKANYQLAVIGTNLNQVARALNSGQHRTVELSLLEKLTVAVKRQVRTMRDVVDANIGRWDIKL